MVNTRAKEEMSLSQEAVTPWGICSLAASGHKQYCYMEFRVEVGKTHLFYSKAVLSNVCLQSRDLSRSMLLFSGVELEIHMQIRHVTFPHNFLQKKKKKTIQRWKCWLKCQ